MQRPQYGNIRKQQGFVEDMCNDLSITLVEIFQIEI